MKTKKILFIVPRFHTNLYYQVEALQEAGHDVRVLVLYKGFSERYEGMQVVEIGYSWLYNKVKWLFSNKESYLKSGFELKMGLPSFRNLRREVKEFVPDIIFLKAYLNLFALSIFLLNFFQKRKLFVLTQTKKGTIKGSVFILRIYFAFAKICRVEAFISPIKKTKEILSSFGNVKSFYLPFTFPIENNLNLERKGDVLKVMTVGKFVKRKEILLLLKAFNQLLKEGYSELRLNIFGEKADLDYVEKVERYIERNKLEKFVQVRYNLENKEILQEYSKNHFFVLPSSNEPAAYSIVEAMGNGLPVICSDQCGTKCYINGNGYVFKSRDILDLKKKMKLMLKKNALEKMSKISVELMEKRHGKEVFIKKVEDIISN